MRTYEKHINVGQENGTYYTSPDFGGSIPEVPGNRHYDQMIREVADGLAEIVEVDDTPVPTVDDIRREAYGDIGGQLDQMYWDQVNGTTNWKDHIAAVKAANPKAI